MKEKYFRNQLANNAQAKDYIDTFLTHAVRPICSVFQISGHNRARQRDKYGHLLEDLANLQDEVSRIDAFRCFFIVDALFGPIWATPFKQLGYSFESCGCLWICHVFPWNPTQNIDKDFLHKTVLCLKCFQADKVDAYLHSMLKKLDPNRQHLACFGNWVLCHTLQVMINYLLAGFELELYAVHEYHYIFWFVQTVSLRIVA